mmetsp:Transcript_39053/g.71105  ORF Transcript_39053/g.71105 Transcript_39053/m.71105 type:complete len:202 (-) Transcript_39053:150-755(-)
MTSSSVITSETPPHVTAMSFELGSNLKHFTPGVAINKAFPVTALNSLSPIARETAKEFGTLPITPIPCASALLSSRIRSSKPGCASRGKPSPMSTMTPPASLILSASASLGVWFSVVSATEGTPSASLLQMKHLQFPNQATNTRTPKTRTTTTVAPSLAVRNLARKSPSISSKTPLRHSLTASSVQLAASVFADSFFSSRV